MMKKLVLMSLVVASAVYADEIVDMQTETSVAQELAPLATALKVRVEITQGEESQSESFTLLPGQHIEYATEAALLVTHFEILRDGIRIGFAYNAKQEDGNWLLIESEENTIPMGEAVVFKIAGTEVLFKITPEEMVAVEAPVITAE